MPKNPEECEGCPILGTHSHYGFHDTALSPWLEVRKWKRLAWAGWTVAGVFGVVLAVLEITQIH